MIYQQVENTIIQPRIQSRAVQVEPFVVLVAVLFGSTLFGVFGALLAIPAAATLQIAIHEYSLYRRSRLEADPDEEAPPDPPPEPGSPPDAPAGPRGRAPPPRAGPAPARHELRPAPRS